MYAVGEYGADHTEILSLSQPREVNASVFDLEYPVMFIALTANKPVAEMSAQFRQILVLPSDQPAMVPTITPSRRSAKRVIPLITVSDAVMLV